MSAKVLLGVAVLCALARPVHAGLPRILVADLHGQGDLKEVGVGISTLLAASLARSGQVEVVQRQEVIRAFGKVGLPARDGLWLGPAEARAVCEATQCTQILVGTLSRDAVQLAVTLRLLQHDGSVAKSVKLKHPLRQLPLLAIAASAKAKELLRIDAPPPPAARALTLQALGGAWIAVQKRDADFAVIEVELAGQPTPLVLKFAQPAGDLVAVLGTITESPAAKVRAQLAIDPQAALKQAEALSDSKPNDTQARFLYARTLIEAGKGKEALALLAPREGEAEIAEAHELRGRALLQLKNVAKARDELGRAIELDAQNAEAHYFYGEALVRAGDHQRALAEYEIASDGLRRKGDGRAVDAIIHALQIDARMSKVATQLDGRDLLPEDIQTARQAVERSGSGADVSAAAVSAAAGDNAASGPALAAARTRDPKNPGLSRLAARVAAEQGDHKGALAAFEAAYSVSPTPDLALDAAREARAAGDVAKARELYTKAFASPQLEALAARELGELELQKGDPRQAVDLLKRAAAAEPDDAEVHVKLAQALSATGDVNGANAAKLAASALDPEIAVERSASTGPAANPEVGKVASAPAQAGAPPAAAQAQVELATQLPPLLRTFPCLRDHGGGGTVVMVRGAQPLLQKLLPKRRVNAAAFEKALISLLGPDGYHFDRIVPPVEAGDAEPTTEALLRLADAKGGDVVLHYGTEVEGENIKVVMTALDHRARKVYTNEATLHAPNAIGSLNLVPIEIIVATLVVLIGYFLLRPRGKLLVKINYDAQLGGGMFSVRIFRVRRRGMGLKGGSEQSYVDAVRKSGASVSSRAATMIGKETEFRLPAGKWWVYLFGVYVKDNKPQGNFLTEKRVTVPRNRIETAEFNMIPEETSVLIKVVSHGNPIYGAAVWLNQDEHKAVYTNKSADGALMLVPRGMHIVTARTGDKQVVQNLGVASAQPMECVIDMTHAESVPDVLGQAGRDRGTAAVAVTAVTPSSVANMHASLQGQMYDLDSSASPSSTAVANATRYELRKELGRGAMGVVYEALDTVLERSVALKVISQELKNRPDVVELFMREARSLAQLNHPNIVTVFDFGQRGDEYFMALELVHGKTLEELMSEVGGPMPLGQVIDAAIEVCGGLSYAHERRVIHRDIKPANIFLLHDGRVKIMDFGLARVVRELSIKKTMISGTPLYMSPEQIRGTDLDFRADLYSLGCMVYEMLCGTPPFYQGEILYHHSHTMPDPPTARLPTLPPEVDSVIMRCLEKAKEARYASVAEFAQALKGLKARLSNREAAL